MESMVEQGKKLADIAKNIVVKLPSTVNGFSACRILNQQKIKVNVTLCFSANQAIFAAKSGAAYISPFVGRLDDIGENGMELIKNIKTIYNNYEIFTTEILVASIRNKHKVIILGPTTFTSFLDSLLVGFETLQITKDASRIYDDLQKIATKFSTHMDQIEDVVNKITKASEASSKFSNSATSVKSLIDNINKPKE